MQVPKKIYDITQPLFHNCPGYPGLEPTILTRSFQHSVHGFNAEILTINMHSGTHLDVPFHFFADGKALDQFPIDTFAGPCVIFDLSKSVKPDSAITPEDLKPHMSSVSKGDIVLLHTGYGPKRGFSKEYLLEYPFVGGPAGEMLAEAGVKGVGTDALSIGGFGSPEKAAPGHLALLSKDIFLIEELLIPKELLDGKKRFLTAFPLPVQGCSGALVRAVVMEF
ncbi:cyclase family protein [Desulfovibrio sp. OttesenSCG-928-C06]|nr:cyclase family protein [Desulfovibrio sp. OttesenSCG-928-C06]